MVNIITHSVDYNQGWKRLNTKDNNDRLLNFDQLSFQTCL